MPISMCACALRVCLREQMGSNLSFSGQPPSYCSMSYACFDVLRNNI